MAIPDYGTRSHIMAGAAALLAWALYRKWMSRSAARAEQERDEDGSEASAEDRLFDSLRQPF